MNEYTIYCTPEQTRKALELGAPIDNCPIMFAPEGIPKYERQLRDDRWITFPCPTTEQMIGWLVEQGIYVDIETSWSKTITTVVLDVNRKKLLCSIYKDSRKEATLAAIDKALEYLLNE